MPDFLLYFHFTLGNHPSAFIPINQVQIYTHKMMFLNDIIFFSTGL
jgi:hypothetical protein